MRRSWRLGPVGKVEAVADDIEVLLWQVGFEQLAIGQIEELDRDRVLRADGSAGVFDCHTSAIHRGFCVRLWREGYRYEEAVFFRDEHPCMGG